MLLKPLYNKKKKKRIVAGLMSGTSVDGVDAVIAKMSDTGRSIKIKVLSYASEPYEREVRDLIIENSNSSGASAEAISQLNAAIPWFYMSALRKAAKEADIALDKIDLIGSHGQTIHHVPVPKPVGIVKVVSTLQIGDGSVLANLAGAPVVSDFRTADMALGGQGAPLAAYFDFIRFSDPEETRVMLNLGGIANVTFLPAGCERDEVVAFDTGPANMVIDGLAQRLLDLPFDDDGRVAARSKPHSKVLDELLHDRYYRQNPPKTTGRELFGAPFVDEVCREFEKHFGPEAEWDDSVKARVIATATALTAKSVKLGLDTVTHGKKVDRVISSGGGTNNSSIMSMLQETLKPTRVERIDKYGVASTAKEALFFAVMAHEFVNGVPTGMPSVTGASKAAMQGKLSLPS
jgi:anhydro-N-acetylmuramic acid kinase